MSIALIDFFSCSFERPDDDEMQYYDNLHHFFSDLLANVFNIECSIEDAGRGYFGYTNSLKLGAGGSLGMIAYGGESQGNTVFFSLTGAGCKLVDDWAVVREWGEQRGARITRIDLAHDDFNGDYLSFEKVESWYLSGQFTNGGRAPSARAITDYDSGAGKTLYVGKRQNGKMFRGYEKGRQLGKSDSNWFRVEVEFRNKDRIINWDILTNPDYYLAGAYPCLNFLSRIQSKFQTVQKTVQITYERVLNWLRTSAGAALHALAGIHHGDIYQLFSLIARPGTPSRLRPYYDNLKLAEPISV